MKTNKIKFGSALNLEIEKLTHSLVNRDTVDNHVDTMVSLIKNYGFLSPIIVNSKYNIIEGHHRVLAAQKLEIKIIPVYIVDWVDTENLDEYQKYIISLNANNRKWTSLDYLKSFSRNKEDYRYVNNKYNKYKNILSVGNLLNFYFNSGSNVTFRNGKGKIKDMNYSDYLCDNFVRLKTKYGGVKFQAFTINRCCKFAHSKIKNIKEMDYIFRQLELLAKNDSHTLSSVEHINSWLKQQLTEYRNIIK